jgi:hypothetical protein
MVRQQQAQPVTAIITTLAVVRIGTQAFVVAGTKSIALKY